MEYWFHPRYRIYEIFDSPILSHHTNIQKTSRLLRREHCLCSACAGCQPSGVQHVLWWEASGLSSYTNSGVPAQPADHLFPWCRCTTNEQRPAILVGQIPTKDDT